MTVVDIQESKRVSKLRWPGFWNFVFVIVPPILLLPSVKLSSSWGNEPGEGFHASDNNPESEGNTNISAHLATVLGSSNEEGDENPEGPHPGEWNAPSDSSVVDLLHDSVFALLNVGKEPESSEGSESCTKAVSHNAESVPFTIGEAPIVVRTVPVSTRPPCSEEDGWNNSEEPPNKSEPDGLKLVVLVEVNLVERGRVRVAHFLI